MRNSKLIVRAVFLSKAILVFLTGQLHGQGSEELLMSKRVSNYIFLTPDFAKKTLFYQLDNQKDIKYNKTLKDKLSVAVSTKDEEIALSVMYFNPFKYRVILSDTLLIDENYQSLSKFFESISGLLTTLSGQTPGVTTTGPLPVGAAAAGISAQIATLKSPLLSEWRYLYAIGKINDCKPEENLKTFVDQLSKVDNYFYGTEDDNFQKKVKESLEKISSSNSITELTSALVVYKKNLADITDPINKESKKALNVLESEYEKFKLDNPASPCTEFTLYTKTLINELLTDVKEKQKKKDDIINLLSGLSKELDEFIANTTKENAIVVGRYTVSDEKIREISIVFKERDVIFENNKVSVQDKKEILAKKIRVRAYRTLIPELATGIFYTNLKYQNYGTKEEGGKTIVSLGKEDKYPIVAAEHLNLILNNYHGTVHPMIQIGVGTAKERPSLLGGAGLRFSKPKKLSLSFGGIWVWKKELTSLQEGSEVKGTADLEKDLKFFLDTKPSFYIGIQMNF